MNKRVTAEVLETFFKLLARFGALEAGLMHVPLSPCLIELVAPLPSVRSFLDGRASRLGFAVAIAVDGLVRVLLIVCNALLTLLLRHGSTYKDQGIIPLLA